MSAWSRRRKGPILWKDIGFWDLNPGFLYCLQLRDFCIKPFTSLSTSFFICEIAIKLDTEWELRLHRAWPHSSINDGHCFCKEFLGIYLLASWISRFFSFVKFGTFLQLLLWILFQTSTHFSLFWNSDMNVNILLLSLSLCDSCHFFSVYSIICCSDWLISTVLCSSLLILLLYSFYSWDLLFSFLIFRF